jgi:hypothetical protein
MRTVNMMVDGVLLGDEMEAGTSGCGDRYGGREQR